MRKFQTALFAVVASAALATAAHAQSADGDTHGYATVGYQHSDLSLYGKGLTSLNVSAALNVWKFISVEGDLAIDGGSKSTTYEGHKAKAELENNFAGYAVATYTVSPNFDVLGRVGFLEAKTKAHGGSFSDEQQASGPAIGVGVHYFPHGGKNGIALDLTYADFDRDGHDSIGQIAYVRRF